MVDRGYRRFDSLSALKWHCREVYSTDDVWVGFNGHELVARVGLDDGSGFESLVVHLEGEMTYLVWLPPLGGREWSVG